MARVPFGDEAQRRGQDVADDNTVGRVRHDQVRRDTGQGIPVLGDGPGVANRAEASC
jgi:hypothetical protein